MTSPSNGVGAGYGLWLKIEMSSHPGRMRCDQLFGAEHKGCSVPGKAALKGLRVWKKLKQRKASPRWNPALLPYKGISAWMTTECLQVEL